MTKIKLQFRAILPDGTIFYQKNQYLTSFLRRVLTLLKVSHPTYLEKDLEDYLQIRIKGEWIDCSFDETEPYPKGKIDETMKEAVNYTAKNYGKML